MALRHRYRHCYRCHVIHNEAKQQYTWILRDIARVGNLWPAGPDPDPRTRLLLRRKTGVEAVDLSLVLSTRLSAE